MGCTHPFDLPPYQGWIYILPCAANLALKGRNNTTQGEMTVNLKVTK
jgi:hypothetical protein